MPLINTKIVKGLIFTDGKTLIVWYKVKNIIEFTMEIEFSKKAKIRNHITIEKKIASSKESVGDKRRFWEFSKAVIQGNFYRFKGSKSVRFSHSQFHFIV